MSDSFTIGSQTYAAGRRVCVIAEAGVNHNGDVAAAKRLIDAAAASGADVVKFQTFRAARLAAADAPKAQYQLDASKPQESQVEMLRNLELSPQEFRDLRDHCAAQRITFLSTPFDEESVDLLEDLEVPAFKVGSGDLTNTPLLRHIARKGKPVILSTGMSTLGEIEAALDAMEDERHIPVCLLHCTSSYPAKAEDVNLLAMDTMRQAFGLPVGYSDHTLGHAVCLAAVARGAVVVEKHFTLDRRLPGPDHKASLEPEELKLLVDGIRIIEQAMGSPRKRPTLAEQDTAAVARRSIVATRDIAKGAQVEMSMIGLKRPGNGLPWTMHALVVGRHAKQDIKDGDLLSLDMFA